MYEGRRLQRVVRSLPMEMMGCEPAQFLVDHPHQAICSLPISTAPPCQECSDLLGIGLAVL